MKKGKLYGVGVGPGDSKLMTVKAVEILKKADIIITPKTEKKDDSVALNIAKPYILPETQVLPIVFPMVVDKSTWGNAWEENKNLIESLLDEGKNVVFLTLGDPMFYSTYMYIFRALEKTKYEIETIPGIPAFLSIASYLGYPVVEMDEMLTVLPATADEEKMDKILAVADNVVIMKVYKKWPIVKKLLKKHQLLQRAVMISRAGLPDEEVFTNLEAIAEDAKLNYLSTILTKRDFD